MILHCPESAEADVETPRCKPDSGASGEASKDFKGSADDQGRSVTLTTTTTQSIAFDSDLYYKNAADSLRAMHQMFIGYMTSHR